MKNSKKSVKKEFLFGNEAVVQGALEAGIGYASSYPGTPATEIGDAFSKIAKKEDIYYEYSTNEKVALEGAAGAAFSGVNSLVSIKHYGLNVSCDSLLPLVYLPAPCRNQLITKKSVALGKFFGFFSENSEILGNR